VEALLELKDRLIYSVAFHPEYRTNGQIYLFTHGSAGEFARKNRISRFTVGRQAPYPCDPQSEHVIIEWRSEGHDGGGIVFGRDGMLYISTGDGTADSDGWVSGQDLSELLGGVLRIDVDHTEGTQAYSVPGDNPFVGMPNARPEKWAYGLRNPWRLSVDPKTGAIWAGNNGQDLWETVHLIRRGENYGWSVYEGSHPFYLNRKLGPTPVVPPTTEHSHSEARSLTGGVVYYGDQLSELNGTYVYGDYSTGKIWGVRHDGSRVVWQNELADTQLQITAFAVSYRGELLIADHAGGIYRLIRSPRQESAQEFPMSLSQTGLYLSTRDHQTQPGLIPYSVNAPGCADGAHVERFMALPDDSRIGNLANGTVLVQTLSLEREAENPKSLERIETRLLIRQDGEWAGYSYRWNDSQTDATLVGAKGDEKELVIKDNRLPAGSRQQTWRFPSRAECMTCHSRAANFVLGITELQLNKMHDYGSVRDNQLRTLQHIGVFTGTLPRPEADRLVDPYDTNQSLDARARSYLHVNCSVCHVESGGGQLEDGVGICDQA
jgi:glucose/arabinose dehydrogenase